MDLGLPSDCGASSTQLSVAAPASLTLPAHPATLLQGYAVVRPRFATSGGGLAGSAVTALAAHAADASSDQPASAGGGTAHVQQPAWLPQPQAAAPPAAAAPPCAAPEPGTARAAGYPVQPPAGPAALVNSDSSGSTQLAANMQGGSRPAGAGLETHRGPEALLQHAEARLMEAREAAARRHACLLGQHLSHRPVLPLAVPRLALPPGAQLAAATGEGLAALLNALRSSAILAASVTCPPAVLPDPGAAWVCGAGPMAALAQPSAAQPLLAPSHSHGLPATSASLEELMGTPSHLGYVPWHAP